ncbi:MAG: hypothetical protein GF417_10265 [Candidatus Latescibacteria bacterium]|nr:hypothetical protein [Candidatus Latescibacterota bacterium]
MTERTARIPLYYHPDFAGYDFGPGHPFRGERFTSFMESLRKGFPEVYSRFEILTPEPASEEMILRAHQSSYYQRLLALEERSGRLTLDTMVLPGSIKGAAMIAGASVAAVRAAAEGGVAVTFGGLHHAGSDYGGGFCLVNDVAVAAMDLLDRGFSRIAILDTDAHQGNGTMDIFYRDPRVLFISLHQNPRTLFPGVGFTDETGAGEGAGYTVNIPLPPLSDITVFRRAVNEVVFPLLEMYQPEMIIRNGGSDPLVSDTLTNLGLDLEGLRELIHSIHSHSRKMGVPVADLFLSGYGPHVTEGWLVITSGITGDQIKTSIPGSSPPPDARIEFNTGVIDQTISELKSAIEPYWGSL